MKTGTLILLILLAANAIQAQTNRTLNSFAHITLAEKPCTITGTLRGYDPKVDSFKYCSIIYNHLYKSDQQTHVGEISATGKFSITFPLNRPQELMFEVGEDLVGFYGVPGTSLDVTIDLLKMKAMNKLPYAEQVKLPDPLSFNGKFAQLNKENSAFRPTIHTMLHYKEHSKMIDSLDQLPYKAYRLGKMQSMLDTLAAFNNRHNTTTEFRQLMTQYIRYFAADDLLRYSWLHSSAKKEKRPTALSPEYLSFMADHPIDSDEAIITDAYSSYLNEFTNAKSVSGFRYYPDRADTLAYLKQLPAGQQGLADEVRKTITVPYSARTSVQHQVIYTFDSIHRQEFQEYVGNRYILKTADSVLLPLPASKGRDIICASLIQDNLDKDHIPFQEEDLQHLTRNMNDKDLLSQLQKENNRLRDAIAGVMPRQTNIRTSLEVGSDQFFDELMKPYKGKVVYIDFWAPWCGPCMGEMPSSKILQQELKGKDVVFLYIGISCTKTSWENTIKDKGIVGEHYYASENEGKLLSAKFKISGIPHYVLVDKQGNVADGRTYRPSDKNKLVKKIDGLLKK